MPRQGEQKRIELESLRLGYFKGQRDLRIDARGRDFIIRGDNATGKTTAADAFAWVLFGKDSRGRADFEIKTLTPSGEPLHNLEHEVEVALRVNGDLQRLRKTYAEKWVRKRGQADRTFTGHETTCYVDDVPVTKTEYEAAVAAIAAEEVFRLLTDPLHFADRMHWQERRRILLELCGDVTDADVIASDPVLADLPEILGDRTMEQLRKVVNAQRAKINDELRAIPVRIDETRRQLPEIAGIDGDGLQGRLADLRKQRRKAEEERSTITAGGQIAEKTKALRETEAELQEIANRLRAAATADVDKIRTQLSGACAELDVASREAKRRKADLVEAAEEIERIEARLEQHRTRWRDVDAEAFEHDEPNTCAACGQKLPAEKVEAARQKALAAFNAEKARRLQEIDAEGKRLRVSYDELATDAEARDSALAAAAGKVEQIESTVADLQKRLEDAQTSVPDPNADPPYKKAVAAHKQLEEEILQLRAGTAEALDQAAAKIAEIDEGIAELEASASRIEQRAKGGDRIRELESEERKLAAQYEELERQLWLCDEFTRRKVSLLTDRINSRFEIVSFRLFRPLVNGGVEECCDVTIGGVPYKDANHGAQINGGLEIVDALTGHYGIAPCVWIDGAESVTEIRPTIGQQIRLVVDAASPELSVELTEAKPQEAAV